MGVSVSKERGCYFYDILIAKAPFLRTIASQFLPEALVLWISFFQGNQA